MRVRTDLLAISLFAALSLPAQARQGESTTVEFPQAYSAAIALARKDAIDFGEDALFSLTFNRSEFSEVADRKRSDDYSMQFREPLKGKEYWLACFGPKDPHTLGGVRCFAMERGTLRLLSTHRSR
jgi:hypothetical protein